jgi:CBS-domain-containing membrane protein
MRKMSDIVRNQDPVTLPPSATVREACRSMRDGRVGAVLVTEDDHCLVGIFTGRDAVRRVLAEGKNAAHTTSSEVMTRQSDTIPSGKMAIEALRLMEDGRHHRIASDSVKCKGHFMKDTSTDANLIVSYTADSSAGLGPCTSPIFDLKLGIRKAARENAPRRLCVGF